MVVLASSQTSTNTCSNAFIVSLAQKRKPIRDSAWDSISRPRSSRAMGEDLGRERERQRSYLLCHPSKTIASRRGRVKVNTLTRMERARIVHPSERRRDARKHTGG